MSYLSSDTDTEVDMDTVNEVKMLDSQKKLLELSSMKLGKTRTNKIPIMTTDPKMENLYKERFGINAPLDFVELLNWCIENELEFDNSDDTYIRISPSK